MPRHCPRLLDSPNVHDLNLEEVEEDIEDLDDHDDRVYFVVIQEVLWLFALLEPIVAQNPTRHPEVHI